MEKIVIAGGTGFLGNLLIEYFISKTNQIIILTRGKERLDGNVHYVQWDGKTLGKWKQYVNHSDVLINMTGRSVDCRYHQKNKNLILNSRVDATLILQQAIEECSHPPKVWLNSSTATIYRHSLDKEMNETEGEIGTGFSVSVAKQWEHAFFKTPLPNTRKVALRTSIVLGKKGGALPTIAKLTKFGLGGKQGSGKQKISWIHEHDFCRAVDFIIKQERVNGTINIVAPKPTTNQKFMQVLRNILRIPFGIPTPKSILELGAKLIGTETELVLKSRNVIPGKLQELQFQFAYPNLKEALQQIQS